MFRLPQQRALKKLIRVLPVAQTQVHEGIAVTVTSLDCYEHGFDVHLYIWCDADDCLAPHFLLRALFDGKRPVPGGVHAPREVGTHDSGDPHWYYSCHLNPSPDPSVRAVQLFIPVIHLAEMRPHETTRLVRDIPGPWAFIAVTSGEKTADEAETVVISPRELDAAWASPERVRSLRETRQQRTMPQYGAIYDLVLETLYRYDPWWVGWKGDVPFGAEEYAPEADQIVPRLTEAQSADDIRRIIHEVMGLYYGKTLGGEERYAEMAQEIWWGYQQVQ